MLYQKDSSLKDATKFGRKRRWGWMPWDGIKGLGDGTKQEKGTRLEWDGVKMRDDIDRSVEAGKIKGTGNGIPPQFVLPLPPILLTPPTKYTKRSKGAFPSLVVLWCFLSYWGRGRWCDGGEEWWGKGRAWDDSWFWSWWSLATVLGVLNDLPPFYYRYVVAIRKIEAVI